MVKRTSGWRDESGQIVLLTALSMAVLLGVAALSLDVSLIYDKRNQLQAAADAAAKSAAIEVQLNPAISLSSLQNFANQQVTAFGFDPAGTTTVTVHHGPTSGAFSGNVNFVEVLVSEPTNMIFGRALGWTSMTPGGRAVAGSGNPTNCVITTAPPGSVPVSFQIGNTTLTMNGCGVGISGNVNPFNPNSTITGSPLPAVSVTGTCLASAGVCAQMGTLTTGAPPPFDPLSGLTAPTNPGGCGAGTTSTLNPGCYSSISSSVRTLTAGLYYITGTVDIGNLTGTNVTLYLTGAGNLSSGNNNALHLTAPTTGTYTGIAIFQDASDSHPFSVNNSFQLDVSGAMYFPGTDVDFGNHLSLTSNTCTLFIAHSINAENGSGSMSNSGCASTFGGAAFLSITIVE